MPSRAHYPPYCVLAHAPWKESLTQRLFLGIKDDPGIKDEVKENKAGKGQKQNKNALLS